MSDSPTRNKPAFVHRARKPAFSSAEGSPEETQNDAPEHRTSNITPGHVRVFHALTSGFYDSFTLWSCRINGEPGVAIVMVDEVGEGKMAVMPLFVAITPNMDIVFDGEGETNSDGGGGGPKRADPSQTVREFQANKAAFTPGGAS